MHREHRVEEDFFSRSIKAYYDSPEVPGVYAARSDLLEAERFILTYLADELRGRSLLDIGVGHADRLRILREAHRVLHAPGIFVFSVHNLATERKSPWALPRLSRRPGASVRALRKYIAGIVQHLRLRRHQQRGRGYAVASDGYFDHGLLTYYVAREEQRQQLAETGFSRLQEVGADGSLLAPGAPCRDAWIFYIARKAA